MATDDYIAHSWNDGLELIKALRGQLAQGKRLWFRGQSNAAHALLPSLLRFGNGLEKEQFLFQKFRQMSLRIFPRRSEDWEVLFDMQHYGIPTRLLDWTDTLGIAAFFAAVYNSRFHPTQDAAIFILDPCALNDYSGIDRVPIIPDDETLKYRDIYWHNRPFKPNYPIGVEPLFLNDRILAQKGMFTIHGNNTGHLERLCPNAVKRVVLSPTAVADTLEFLEIANINEHTVYPDIHGIVDFIKRDAGLQ